MAFEDEKNCSAPVAPAPWRVKVFEPDAAISGFTPPRMRSSDVSATTSLPSADCEALNPPTVEALTAKPEEFILWRGERFSKVTPTHELATCAATSVFK